MIHVLCLCVCVLFFSCSCFWCLFSPPVSLFSLRLILSGPAHSCPRSCDMLSWSRPHSQTLTCTRFSSSCDHFCNPVISFIFLTLSITHCQIILSTPVVSGVTAATVPVPCFSIVHVLLSLPESPPGALRPLSCNGCVRLRTQGSADSN